MKVNVLLVIACTLFTGCKDDGVVPLHQSIDEMNQLIRDEMQRLEIPSIAACIVKDQEIVWMDTYGYHDIESQSPPTEETIYLLASISKTFVAVAAMQLYERGLLNIDAPIGDYLPFEIGTPHFPDIPITARMLLTHTSGLSWPTNDEDPNFNNRFPGDSAPALNSWIKEYVLPGGDKYISTTWRATVPGEDFQYTNIGVALLGYLIEAISGQDFAEYCQENIFLLLEMHNSGFKLRDVDSTKLATLYHLGEEIDQYSVPHYPAGTVKSSVTGLSHFLIAIMNGGIYQGNRILKESTVNEMLDIKLPSADIAYLWRAHSEQWMGHTGGYWGSSTSMDFHRDAAVGVIILSNTNGVESLYPGGWIYEILHNEARRYVE